MAFTITVPTPNKRMIFVFRRKCFPMCQPSDDVIKQTNIKVTPHR